MRNKKTVLLMALLVVVLAVLTVMAASCGENAQTPGGNTPAVSGEANTEEEEEEYTGPVPELPEGKTFGGADFLFLVGENDFIDVDVQNSESNGDVLQDAIVKRNLAIEDKYDVDIKQEQVAHQSLVTNVYNLSASGDMPYSAIIAGADFVWPMAQQELLADLTTDVPYIDLDAPWWDQGTRKDCSIKGHLFYCANSQTLSTNDLTWIAMFNKKMLSDVGLSDSDLYGYVKDGTWTLDKYAALTRTFIKDLNNDGYMNCADQYGTSYQGSGPDGFLISGGLRFITKDENDELAFAELDDRALDVLNKVYTICKGGTAFNSHFAGTNDKIATETEYGRTLFIENRSLFFTESLGSSQGFRDMDADFGIIPLPKYDEATEVYTSFVHNGLGGMMAVPMLCKDVDMSGMILEDMAFLSYRDVEPVYFGKVIDGKVVRDSESMEMVEYIVQNRVIELGIGMGLSIVGQIRDAMNNGTPIFSSIYARAIRAAKVQVEEINDQFE